jgi:hypothetical protein
MKRIAGEDGSCWTSRKMLAKQCGISVRRLDKSILYLVKHEWIEGIGKKEVMTKGGMQEANEYRIADLWKLNVDYYESLKGSASGAIPKDEGSARVGPKVVHEVHQGGARGAQKQEPDQEEPDKKIGETAETSSAIPLLLKEFESLNPAIKRMYSNKIQRNACAALLKEYGFERLVDVIKNTLPKTNDLPFFPTITTPVQLNDKWASLGSAIRKYQLEHNNLKANVAF